MCCHDDMLCVFQGLSLTQDPATSDDSGRASERLTGSSVAPRDADSSRDRLSDVCNSPKRALLDYNNFYFCPSRPAVDAVQEKDIS